MEKIIIGIRKRMEWPLIVDDFLAWRESSKVIITIKRNKANLFLMRVNGTLVGASSNEEVILDFISERVWEKSGIIK